MLTFSLRYPRPVHAELMTHRVFSRNAGSSRAIPVATMLKQVRTDPAMLAEYGGNRPGMQSKGEHDELVKIPGFLNNAFREWQGEALPDDMPYPYEVDARTAWKFSIWLSSHMAEAFMDAGYHKQVANRLIEAGQYISVVLTATCWDNWYALRKHTDADPTIHLLASTMLAAHEASTPVPRKEGEWHLPYVRPLERITLGLVDQIKVSVARCARVSYNTHEGKEPNLVDDLLLHDRLVKAVPPHMSPTEHQCMPRVGFEPTGNFKGWKQYRQFIEQGRIPGQTEDRP